MPQWRWRRRHDIAIVVFRGNRWPWKRMSRREVHDTGTATASLAMLPFPCLPRFSLGVRYGIPNIDGDLCVLSFMLSA